MTAAAQEPSEWHRLAAASSLVDVVARHVDDLVQISTEDLPGWLTRLGVPAGWRIAHLSGGGVQPSRIAVCSRQFHGGGDGCETINVYRFTGIPPVAVVRNDADCTLRDLDADDITTQTLATPPLPTVSAVRSSGYFTTAGLRAWAQYSTYIAGSYQPGQGRLIQHGVFVESGSRAGLNDDINQLSNTIHHAFLTIVGTH